MTAKNLFLFQGLVLLAFGFNLLIAPRQLLGMYATQKDVFNTELDSIAQSYGAVFLAIGITYLIVRNDGPSNTRRGFFFQSLIGNVLVGILNVKANIQGVQNSLGWTTVALCVVLAGWSALLLSKEGK